MLLKSCLRIPTGFISSSRNSYNRRLMSGSAPKEIKIPVPCGHIAGKVWNGGGFPIIGLHGWMDNAGTWDRIAPLLPPEMSLISIDFPGHGLSPSTQISGSTFLDLALIIERVVQHFNFKEVNLLGHSMGGGAAFIYAATFPEKVKKVIMIDLIKPISIEAENQPERTAKSIQDLLLTETKLGREPLCYEYDKIVDKMVQGYGENLTEQSAKILLKRGSVQHENGQYSFSYDPRVKIRNILSLNFEQQKAFAQRLKCEMLVIKASKGPFYEDQALYDEMIKIYKEKTKVFKYVTIEGTHHLHLNDPHIVAPVICSFLDGNAS